jgi:hypothetical protein
MSVRRITRQRSGKPRLPTASDGVWHQVDEQPLRYLGTDDTDDRGLAAAPAQNDHAASEAPEALVARRRDDELVERRVHMVVVVSDQPKRRTRGVDVDAQMLMPRCAKHVPRLLRTEVVVGRRTSTTGYHIRDANALGPGLGVP